MAKRLINWEVLEPALRKLKKDDLLKVLHDAYKQLPASRVLSVFGEYVDLLALESPPYQCERCCPRPFAQSLYMANYNFLCKNGRLRDLAPV